MDQTKFPHIPVIVSNYNAREWLEVCLRSLLAQDYPDFSVYLMDNASRDGSVEYTAAAFPRVKIIANDRNYGFAGGYNRAVRAVEADYVAIINSDTQAAPDWLSKLYAALREENADIAGSKLCFLGNPGVINSAGKKLTYSGIGIDLGFGEKDGPQFGRRREAAALCGAAMIFRRRAFLALEGFDEDFFILCEDTDLCWRAWLSGGRVVYAPSSRVLHRFGEAIGKRESPLRVFYSQRNSLLIVVKNFGVWRLTVSAFVIAGYTALKAAWFLLTLRLKSLGALAAGTLAAFKMLPRTMIKRRAVQSHRKLTDKDLERKGFIQPLAESVREYVRVSAVSARSR